MHGTINAEHQPMGMCMCMGMWFIFLWTDKFFHDFLVLLCRNASMSTRTLFSVHDPGLFVSFQQPLYRGIIPSFGWVFFANSICSISFLFKIIFNDNFFFVSEHHCVCANVADKTNSIDLQRFLFLFLWLWRCFVNKLIAVLLVLDMKLIH